jgi:hypothetical protein
MRRESHDQQVTRRAYLCGGSTSTAEGGCSARGRQHQPAPQCAAALKAMAGDSARCDNLLDLVSHPMPLDFGGRVAIPMREIASLAAKFAPLLRRPSRRKIAWCSQGA